MVPPMTQLVVKVPVFQQHPTQHAGVHQKLQRSIYRGPPHAGDLLAQFLSGKVSVFLGNCADHRSSRLGIPVASLAQGVDELSDQRVFPFTQCRFS